MVMSTIKWTRADDSFCCANYGIAVYCLMDIEFDPSKDETNRAKHGVSMTVGRIVLENRVADLLDIRSAGEERHIAFGTIEGRLFACAYTMRGTIYRIISVRKANRREKRKWLP